jgi:hypothetical protein
VGDNKHEVDSEIAFHDGGIALALNLCQRATNLWLPAGMVIGASRPYILSMKKKDVVDRLGPPDEIVGREHRMRSRTWVCSTCRETTLSAEPIPIPAPCVRCGGIAFEAEQPVANATWVRRAGTLTIFLR